MLCIESKMRSQHGQVVSVLGPGFKPSTLLLTRFVLSCTSQMVCLLPAGILYSLIVYLECLFVCIGPEKPIGGVVS